MVTLDIISYSCINYIKTDDTIMNTMLQKSNFDEICIHQYMLFK